MRSPTVDVDTSYERVRICAVFITQTVSMVVKHPPLKAVNVVKTIQNTECGGCRARGGSVERVSHLFRGWLCHTVNAGVR